MGHEHTTCIKFSPPNNFATKDCELQAFFYRAPYRLTGELLAQFNPVMQQAVTFLTSDFENRAKLNPTSLK